MYFICTWGWQGNYIKKKFPCHVLWDSINFIRAKRYKIDIMLNTVHLSICMHKIYIYEHTNKILVNYLFGDKYSTRRGCMLFFPLFTMWRNAILCLLVFCVVIVCEAAQIQGKVMNIYTLWMNFLKTYIQYKLGFLIQLRGIKIWSA